MPTTASVYSSALFGRFMAISQVVASTARASSTMDRSASAASPFTIPLMVKATSSAVSGTPSVNITSSRIWNVQVRPSSEQL